MKSFAIFSEGVCDRRVLENLLVGFVRQFDDEDPALNPEWPPEATPGSASPPPGGWTLLLKELRAGRHQDALAFNDFVVIHIDTDVANDAGFDVETAGRDVRQIRDAVISRLEEEMGRESATACAGRLLFAIAVHSTECWLLPLLYPEKSDDAHAAKLTGCLKNVNHALKLRGELSLGGARGAGHKDERRYDEVSTPFRKPKKLREVAGRNPSLKSFVDQLDALVSPKPDLA